jgi:ubiquinone/menaquinone biosynthesis C-methylase UbiE
MVEECFRVLKPGGHYFVISYAENRAKHIMREHVNWEMKTFQKTRLNE